jgi:hypothetical protein
VYNPLLVYNFIFQKNNPPIYKKNNHLERWQKKQVCGSEGMVVGRAGTLLLCALDIMIFCLFIDLDSMLQGRSSACA